MNGIPLGGIGTGKIEVFSNGCVGNFTFLNNEDFPLNDANGILGYHFGIYTKTGSNIAAKLLQTTAVGQYPTIRDIEYQGSFPFAKLKYIDDELPVKIGLECHSIFIPNKARLSSRPCATFLFNIENPLDYDISVSLLIIARNIVGSWEVGRKNYILDENSLLGLVFRNEKSHLYDERSGEICVGIAKGNYGLSYIEGWNMQRTPFAFNTDNIELLAWEYFSKEGRLPNMAYNDELISESRQLGGALCCSCTLKPGQRIVIPVMITWYFARSSEGRMYENDFRDSKDVIKDVMNKRENTYAQTQSLHNLIIESGLDSWLKDALLNNLYPLISSTLWSRDDEFGVFEAPQSCPLMGTLDVRYYGSIPLALLFPELEMKEMLEFAKAQRKDGYIPHDLGRKRLDCPSCGTTPFFWKDLNPKFILLAYRDWLWIKDEKFLQDIYPAVEKALRWSISSDKNGDGLPDLEGQDQTFDMWQIRGNSSYVSGIFLASLLAAKKLAELMNDRPIQEMCDTLFKKASANFEERLFNGRYFILWEDGQDKDDSCMLSQLNGQWYSHLLGLGYIAQKEKIARSVEYILKANCNKSSYGAVNSVQANGEIDKSCQQSENIWPGQCYAFASLAIYEGYKKEGLELAKRVWHHFTDTIKTPWNQPDTLSASTGEFLFGDHYMRNMVVWAILFALKDTEPEARRILSLLSLRVYNSLTP